MPNDCWNHLTIVANEWDMANLIHREFDHVPDWAKQIKQEGKEGIDLLLWSRWEPNYTWLEELLTKYPSCWVKNIWSEEGGMEGVWIGCGGSKEIKQMEWQGMCLEEGAHRFRDLDSDDNSSVV